jgi:hypothetical protein
MLRVVVIVFAAAFFAPVFWAGPQNATARALLADTSSYALHINDAGQAAGSSVVGGVEYATEWSGGNVLNRGRLGDLPGSMANFPNDMNHAGKAVRYSVFTVPELSTWAMMLLGFAGLGAVDSWPSQER